ncbi:fasciculation and elongation protein zeta-2-like protein [Cricetulus griseus]|nr:fasciculation and elongation protein zeta-2-like protein [Cricetulus griseus]
MVSPPTPLFFSVAATFRDQAMIFVKKEQTYTQRGHMVHSSFLQQSENPFLEPTAAPSRRGTPLSLSYSFLIWNALTDNYGNVMPVDWKSSHTRALHLLTLNLSEKGMSDSLLFDTSDEEELREQLDMHSIIVSCVNEEPLFTADQVIEEIEEMMQESPDPEDDETPTQSDRLSMLSQEIQTLKRSSMSSYEERVKRLSVSELNELLEEIETAIKEYSEELVQQLALRDELEFEKEVENSFISALIEVQNRQKEHKETAKKKKKLKNGSSQNGRNERSHMPGTRFSMEGISNVIQNGLRHTFGNSGGEKQYLTTVIPYEKKNGPPSVEDLQILTKILRAMKEDSEKVPSLLTDYILKGEFYDWEQWLRSCDLSVNAQSCW